MTILQPLKTRCLLGRPHVGKAQKLLQCLAEADPLLKSRAFLCIFMLQYWEVSERYLTSLPRALLCFLHRNSIHSGSVRDCFSSCSIESTPEPVSGNLSSCAVVIEPSCPRGLLEHLQPLPNQHFLPRGIKPCWVPGRKHF